MTRLCTPVTMQCLTIISFSAAARSGTGDPGDAIIGDWDKIHVEPDSDNIVMFSLTEKSERRSALIPNAASVEGVGAIPAG